MRDRTIDAVRAYAIVGVVGGHWLVTGLRVDADGAWRQASPLAAMPAFTPVSWVLQTLGLFFFAGGFAATCATTSPWSGFRRLLRPVVLLVGGWTAVLATAAALGTPAGTIRTIAVLVVSPLWFLLPFVALRAVTAPLTRVVDRAGPWAVAGPAGAVVAATDAGAAPGWLAVPAAWSIPWVLGIALARGRFRHRGAGPALIAAGVAGMVVLVVVAGYPASAVGVPGEARSNLNPPTLFAVALACAQIGVFLIVRRHWHPDGRPGRALNRVALPVYLGHQSVLLAVAATGAPGLLTPPSDPQWIIQRLAWLPFLALVLAAVTAPAWWTTRRARAD